MINLGTAVKLASDFGIDYDHKGRASPRPVKKKISEELKLKQAYTEYLLDTLLTGTAEEKAAVIKERGKEVMRIGEWISGVVSSHKAGVEEMLKHFLLGAIRRVFMPGSKYEEMLCLVGGQGAGKSTFSVCWQ